jgi:peptidoglycan/xylan/chitin deacetylase (PgdA/CDA1 family)
MDFRDRIKEFLYGAGYYKVYGRLKGPREKRLLVLMYHDFLLPGSDAEDGGIFEVGPSHAQLDAQLRELTNSYRVVPLRQAVEEIRSSGLKDDSVAITIDDGCVSTYTLAFPLLKKYGLPATVFPVTGWINGEIKQFWWQRLRSMVRRSRFDRVTSERLVSIFGGEKRDLTQNGEWSVWSQRLFFEHASALLRTVKDSELENVLARFEELLSPAGEPSVPSDVSVSWEQAREMSQNNIEFAAHTRTHLNLRFADMETAEREIVESRTEIEKRLGCRVAGFAYPYGKDIGAYAKVEPILEKHGFEYACSAYPGHNDDCSNLYALRRVGLPSTTSRALIGRTLCLHMLRRNRS